MLPIQSFAIVLMLAFVRAKTNNPNLAEIAKIARHVADKNPQVQFSDSYYLYVTKSEDIMDILSMLEHELKDLDLEDLREWYMWHLKSVGVIMKLPLIKGEEHRYGSILRRYGIEGMNGKPFQIKTTAETIMEVTTPSGPASLQEDTPEPNLQKPDEKVVDDAVLTTLTAAVQEDDEQTAPSSSDSTMDDEIVIVSDSDKFNDSVAEMPEDDEVEDESSSKQYVPPNSIERRRSPEDQASASHWVSRVVGSTTKTLKSGENSSDMSKSDQNHGSHQKRENEEEVSVSNSDCMLHEVPESQRKALLGNPDASQPGNAESISSNGPATSPLESQSLNGAETVPVESQSLNGPENGPLESQPPIGPGTLVLVKNDNGDNILEYQIKPIIDSIGRKTINVPKSFSSAIAYNAPRYSVVDLYKLFPEIARDLGYMDSRDCAARNGSQSDFDVTPQQWVKILRTVEMDLKHAVELKQAEAANVENQSRMAE